MYNWKLPEANSSLNGCKTFKWKSDVVCFFKMKTWRVQYDFENVFFSISNLTRCKPLKSKSDAYWSLQFKIMLSKKAPMMKICRFDGVKWTKTWFFGCKHFFKTWHVQNFLIQILTRCIFFNPKSDAFWNF